MTKSFGGPKSGPENNAANQASGSELVQARLTKWFPDLSKETIASLVTIQTEFLNANKSLSLIPTTAIKNFESFHLADSVLASRLIARSLIGDAPLYEASGGSGLPGLVFALLNPGRKVIVVDRDPKKLEFVKQTAAILKISNLATQAGSIDELPASAMVNVVVRGYAPLQRALLACRKQVAKGGRFFHMKADTWATELAQVPSQLFSFWAPSLLGQYKIPETSTEMAVVLTDKLAD